MVIISILAVHKAFYPVTYFNKMIFYLLFSLKGLKPSKWYKFSQFLLEEKCLGETWVKLLLFAVTEIELHKIVNDWRLFELTGEPICK
jgi:hypothetical protein